MWVVKTHGETFYVEHVDAAIPWSTKETPDNPSTKGSLKFKECLLVINDDNEASINVLTDHDKIRLKNRAKGITRIITLRYHELTKCLKDNGIKHGPVKSFGGACTRTWYVVDILDKSHLTMLSLVVQDYRVLAENEFYYKAYDDPKLDIDDFYEYNEDEDEMDNIQDTIPRTRRSKSNDLPVRAKTRSLPMFLGSLSRAFRRIFSS
jgi:hypothetical protein